MSDGMRDANPIEVDTSPRGIAISQIAALGREKLLVIAWAAYDAGLLRTDLSPRKRPAAKRLLGAEGGTRGR